MFEPDGYVLDGPRLMGRQSAGNGFLRAAVAAHAGAPIYGYTPHKGSADGFRDLVLSLDPQAQPHWIPAQRLDLLRSRGVLYRPDQNLGGLARLRLRGGMGWFSLCGVTHTLATGGTLEAIADLLTAPVAPWDALICTSTVALDVVETVLRAQGDYLAWRLGGAKPQPLPQLPVIPLGVHCEDFAFPPEARGQARALLGIADEEVAALFAGRLSISGKAHPFAMYAALEAAAQATGRPMAIVHAGQFFSAEAEQAVRSAAAQFCPSVRAIFVDGKEAEHYRNAWRAADLFISLADSIQETFGLTPVEAMAAGLPVLATDWNGYKDTVRDGVDGFRIATWTPRPGAGGIMALHYEAGVQSYDHYLSQASTSVSIDMAALVGRLGELVVDGDLRRRMGAAGQLRARQTFDWSVVYRQYQELWADLDQRRAQGLRERSAWLAAAPRAQAGALGPFDTFASYPTAHIGPDTLVFRADDADLARFESLTAHAILAFWNPPPELVERILGALETEALSVQRLSDQLELATNVVVEAVARLGKLGLVSLAASA
ncbi:MAG: glycosyl transferase, group 1 [Phenylobacterium sp.]|nr:glycosyl transferase, group 1 [Phenylobacterium sp.]